MKRLVLIAALGLSLLHQAFGQFSAERSAMNHLEKGKWDKSKAQLFKFIRKDSLNTVARYGLSVYFFTPANPDFQIDSAYQYIVGALSDYQLTDTKDRDRMKRFPLDSAILIKHRMMIDSAAFERAKNIHTEKSYIFFLNHFPGAQQRELAQELRDEVAYLDALKVNTYQSFLNYITKYKNAARAGEARKRYEKLLYEAKTRDQTLKSYEAFLKENPKTPYRDDVEKQIFEIRTASGETKDFERFVKDYPRSLVIPKAKNILYHLLRDREQPTPSYLRTDSIRYLEALEKQYLIPFLQNDLFGFMNQAGVEIIKPLAADLQKDYLCGNVTNDVLLMENQLVARNGKTIFKGKIDDYDDMGLGFLKVSSANCVQVIHKSGWQVTNACIEDAKLLSGHYLALKQKSKWSVWTLTGRLLVQPEWTDIIDDEDVMIFKKGMKASITLQTAVAKVADQQPLTYKMVVDDIKKWGKGILWIKKGAEEGTIDQSLDAWIPLKKQELTSETFGAVSKSASGYKLYYWPTGETKNFSHIKINKPWVAANDAGSWKLIDTSLKILIDQPFDSISFVGPFAACSKKDSLRLYFNAKNSMLTSRQAKFQFIPGKDSLFFLLVDEGEKKMLYNGMGHKVLLINYDRVDYIGDGLLGVTKKDKRGIISMDGKIIVQPEYDAIGNVVKGKVSVLKNKKFGFFDISNRIEIKPIYDKNIVVYNKANLIAFKDGYCGLIDWNNKPITKFEFEEIQYWNESTALVRKNFQWILYNFMENRVELDKVKSFKWVSAEGEKIMIFQQENNYGVIGNKRGIIIPPTFSDILNLGSSTHPFYFTEKHVEEASIFVVIYYNAKGELVRRQVFEIDDYERIYCSN